MLEVGIITSDSADNKLYYEINQRYEYYVPFRAIFADERIEAAVSSTADNGWSDIIANLPGLRLAVTAGVLVKGSASSVDLLLVGDIPSVKLKNAIKQIEKIEARELNYSMLSYDEFYYRLSVRDRFITEVLTGKYAVLVDTDNILKMQ
jgi:hypothetical protein